MNLSIVNVIPNEKSEYVAKSGMIAVLLFCNEHSYTMTKYLLPYTYILLKFYLKVTEN